MTKFLEPMGITRDKLAGPHQTVLLGPTQTVTATRPIRHLNPLLPGIHVRGFAKTDSYRERTTRPHGVVGRHPLGLR